MSLPNCHLFFNLPPTQYWENLLVPLDNIINRDTARFVGSKDPDYLTSVYQVCATGV